MTLRTKAAIMAWAADHKIEIEHEVSNHVHAYAPAGWHFASLGTHNYSLWDGGYAETRPDWRAIGKAVGDSELALRECPTDCECRDE